MRFHGEAFGKKLLEASWTAMSAEHSLAVLADEEVMVLITFDFVMRRNPCDFDFPNLTGFLRAR